ncbi:MAG: hypothetical protein CVU03_01920 [Bacteroidetes bacterium HGW-Bacteroidetes-2]|jgi:hypothetical protein|nr:MAG: hypothetical protein CVU13_06395 [Bacteroidetes bacterium HGW-Bacteroidetes-8]PKP26655.1 MAG: hypothetical protein CVU03_01920 [Bacteroidetes bacterium HGW-Bacteroidetes-2]
MKKMLLITLLFFSFKSIAQDPILLETTWYLSDITINNETLSPPIEGGTPQNFILNITETDFTANFCKTASTNIVSFPEFAISVDTYIISGDACAYEPKNEFEAIYFNDFLRINEPTNLYTYDIIIIDAPSPLNNDASVFDTILILTNET